MDVIFSEESQRNHYLSFLQDDLAQMLEATYIWFRHDGTPAHYWKDLMHKFQTDRKG